MTAKKSPKKKPAPRRSRPLTRAGDAAPALGIVPAKPPRTPDEKVRVCIDLMLAGRWRSRTSAALARAWGISAHYMRRLAAEASRRVKAGAEPDYVREVLAAELADALRATRRIRSPGARAKAVADVARAWGAIVVPSKHEVTGGRGLPLGLPPALAMLEPAPTLAELEHFAAAAPEECLLETCRVHGRSAPALPAHEEGSQG